MPRFLQVIGCQWIWSFWLDWKIEPCGVMLVAWDKVFLTSLLRKDQMTFEAPWQTEKLKSKRPDVVTKTGGFMGTVLSSPVRWNYKNLKGFFVFLFGKHEETAGEPGALTKHHCEWLRLTISDGQAALATENLVIVVEVYRFHLEQLWWVMLQPCLGKNHIPSRKIIQAVHKTTSCSEKRWWRGSG